MSRDRSGLIGRPRLPAVRRPPEHVRRKEQRSRIDRRKQEGCRPKHAEVVTVRRHHVLGLAGPPIVPRQPAAINDVRIGWVRRDVAVLVGRDRMPVAHRDLPVVSAARHAGRPAFLLAAADPVRKRVVRAHVVELRRRLVVPGTPRRSAVDGHHRALIPGQQHRVRVVRVDPEAMVVVASGRAAPAGERPAAVCRLPGDDAGGVDDVRVLRVDFDFCKVGFTLGHARIAVDQKPTGARHRPSDTGRRASARRRSRTTAVDSSARR